MLTTNPAHFWQFVQCKKGKKIYRRTVQENTHATFTLRFFTNFLTSLDIYFFRTKNNFLYKKFVYNCQKMIANLEIWP